MRRTRIAAPFAVALLFFPGVSVVPMLPMRLAAAASLPVINPVADGRTNDLGIVVFRSDGSDPKGLSTEDPNSLIYVGMRNGTGRVYGQGREIQINPAIRESVKRIAGVQFDLRTDGNISSLSLPAPAQDAVKQVRSSGSVPRLVFFHVATREDTSSIAEMFAATVSVIEKSLQSGDHSGMVGFVRQMMQMYELKSSACDNNPDPRCERPGVREAFLQIKREEASRR
jgi:hypothetical protein